MIVGGFDGALRAYSAATGGELWRRYVAGRILGGAVIVGNLVFFSTLETNTYAARVDERQIVWKIGMGKYSPGIATDRHYYFSLNGMLVAFRGRNSPPEPVTADGGDGAKAGKRGRARAEAFQAVIRAAYHARARSPREASAALLVS